MLSNRPDNRTFNTLQCFNALTSLTYLHVRTYTHRTRILVYAVYMYISTLVTAVFNNDRKRINKTRRQLTRIYVSCLIFLPLFVFYLKKKKNLSQTSYFSITYVYACVLHTRAYVPTVFTPRLLRNSRSYARKCLSEYTYSRTRTKELRFSHVIEFLIKKKMHFRIHCQARLPIFRFIIFKFSSKA